MEKYEILEIEDAWMIIKILSGEFNDLFLGLYNIGSDGIKMYYKAYILNYRYGINQKNFYKLTDKIVYEIFFKEFKL